LALLGLSGALLALLARHLAGEPVLKPGTSPLLLLAFPALYLYLFAAWRAATMRIGPEVALEGELARRFRAWGTWDSIGAVHLGCRGPKEGTCPRALSSPPKRPWRGGRRGSGGGWGPSRGCSGPWRRAVRSVLPRTALNLGKTAGRPPGAQAEGEGGLARERPSPLSG